MATMKVSCSRLFTDCKETTERKYTMTTTKTSTEELRQQLQAATQRQQDLATEHANLEADIREASTQAARQRAEAARHGESVSTAAADMDVEHLRRRREELPFELWAARITTAQLSRDLHQAELLELQGEDRESAAALEAAQRALKEAEEAQQQAYSRRMSVAFRLDRLRAQLKEDTRTLQQLEEAPPRV